MPRDTSGKFRPQDASEGQHPYPSQNTESGSHYHRRALSIAEHAKQGRIAQGIPSDQQQIEEIMQRLPAATEQRNTSSSSSAEPSQAFQSTQPPYPPEPLRLPYTPQQGDYRHPQLPYPPEPQPFSTYPGASPSSTRQQQHFASPYSVATSDSIYSSAASFDAEGIAPDAQYFDLSRPEIPFGSHPLDPLSLPGVPHNPNPGEIGTAPEHVSSRPGDLHARSALSSPSEVAVDQQDDGWKPKLLESITHNEFKINTYSVNSGDKRNPGVELYQVTHNEYKGNSECTEKDLKSALRARGLSGGRVVIHSKRRSALFHGVVFWSDRLGSEPTGRGLEDFPGQAAIHWETAPTLAR